MNTVENPAPHPGDHCRRCDRKGFELFLVSYYNGYGRDGDNTLERWVCRDCRAQVGEQVRTVFETADPHAFTEPPSPGAQLLGTVVGGIVYGIRELEKKFPVGSCVDFVLIQHGDPLAPKEKVLASGLIVAWDYSIWQCRLEGGKFARFNSLLHNIEIRMTEGATNA